MKREELVNEEILQCSCGCGILKIEQFKDDGYSILSYYPMAFGVYQEGFLYRLWKRIEFAWHILWGKEYSLYEITIESDEDLNRFKAFVAQMRNVEIKHGTSETNP